MSGDGGVEGSGEARSVVALERELAATMKMSSKAVREADLDVSNELDHCMSEAGGWINAKLHLRVLRQGPCLQLARQAAAMLKR